jgi:hypothetical protein
VRKLRDRNRFAIRGAACADDVSATGSGAALRRLRRTADVVPIMSALRAPFSSAHVRPERLR